MKCAESFCKYFPRIKCLDTFPVSTNLRSNGDDSYKTWIGFIVSLGYYALLLWAVITIGTNVLDKSSPNTQEAERIIAMPHETSFDPMSFPIMFGIETKNPTAFYIDEAIFVPTVSQKLRFRNGTKVNIILPIIRCNSSYHGTVGELSDYYQTQIKSSPLYCVNSNTSIYGDFAAEAFQYVRVSFGICKNSTSNSNGCKSLAVIQAALQAGYVSLFMPSYNRDLSNFSKPMTTVGLNLFTTISYNYIKAIDVFYQENAIYTDNGFFYSIYDSTSYNVQSSINEMLDLTSDPTAFTYFDIKMSTIFKEYYRDYPKIINFISDLGGFIQIIFVLLFFVMGPITDFIYLVDLLNAIYRRKDKRVGGLTVELKSSEFFYNMGGGGAGFNSMDERFGNEFEKKSTIKLDLDFSNPRTNKSVKHTIPLTKIKTSDLNTPHGKTGAQTPIVSPVIKLDIPDEKEVATNQFGTNEPITMYNLGSTREMDNLEKKLKNKLEKSLNKVTFSMNICQFIWFKFKSFINMICKRCTSKTDVRYENWFEKIEKKIEIRYVLNKLREIDKLKLLLFGKEQLILFNYLSKPIISEGDSSTRDYSEKMWDIIENPDDYHGEAFQAFDQLRQSTNKLDKKFIQLIDEETRAELIPSSKKDN